MAKRDGISASMCVLSHSVMSDSLQPHGLQPARLLGDSPGKNTGVGYHALLQRIFPTQGSNPGLLHCRQTLLSELLGKLYYQPYLQTVQNSVFKQRKGLV